MNGLGTNGSVWGNERLTVWREGFSARTELFISGTEHIEMENERFLRSKNENERFGFDFKFYIWDNFGTFYSYIYIAEKKDSTCQKSLIWSI